MVGADVARKFFEFSHSRLAKTALLKMTTKQINGLQRTHKENSHLFLNTCFIE